MVKATKNDVRYAMSQIIDREMKKQQRAELKEMMDKLYSESYSEFCNYCKEIVSIDGSDTENVKRVEIDKKEYLVGKCGSCGKELYVRIIMQSPKSLLDSPSARGYFYTKEEALNLPAESVIPETKPKMRGKVWQN